MLNVYKRIKFGEFEPSSRGLLVTDAAELAFGNPRLAMALPDVEFAVPILGSTKDWSATMSPPGPAFWLLANTGDKLGSLRAGLAVQELSPKAVQLDPDGTTDALIVPACATGAERTSALEDFARERGIRPSSTLFGGRMRDGILE